MPAPDLLRLLIKNWTKHGIVPTVTLSTLSLGAQDSQTGWYAKSYVDTSIDMFVIPKQLQFQVLKHGLFIRHDAVAFTKATVHEGDLITDQATNVYTVIAIHDKNIMSQFMFNEVELILNTHASVTGVWQKWTTAYTKFLRTVEKNASSSGGMTVYQLLLAEQDAQTGWYKAHYQDLAGAITISCVILNARASIKYLKPAVKASYTYFGYTLDDVNVFDVIMDTLGRYYRIRTVMPVSIGSKLAFYELGLEKLDQWTWQNLFMLQLDVRAFDMETISMSYYLQGVTVSIYLGGVLISTGLTDALGTYITDLLPGTYDIILSKDGYQTVTKHELLRIQTELMVNLPISAPPMLHDGPLPLNPSGTGVEITYTECVSASMGAEIIDSISKSETLRFSSVLQVTDGINRTEAVQWLSR